MPAVQSVYAEFVHFADLTADLSSQEMTVLERLLQYGKVPVQEGKERFCGGAAFGHDFALVIESDQHRAKLRPWQNQTP